MIPIPQQNGNRLEFKMIDKTELNKAILDASLFGSGFMLGGKHIPISEMYKIDIKQMYIDYDIKDYLDCHGEEGAEGLYESFKDDFSELVAHQLFVMWEKEVAEELKENESYSYDDNADDAHDLRMQMRADGERI